MARLTDEDRLGIRTELNLDGISEPVVYTVDYVAHYSVWLHVLTLEKGDTELVSYAYEKDKVLYKESMDELVADFFKNYKENT